MKTIQEIFDRHNQFLKRLLLPVPEEKIIGRTITDPNNKDFQNPIKTKPCEKQHKIY